MSYLSSAAQSFNATIPQDAVAQYIAGYLLGASDGIDKLSNIVNCLKADDELN